MRRDPAGRERLRAWWGRWSARLDLVFFVCGGLAAMWLAYLIVEEGVRPWWLPALLVVVFWVLVAYLALPRAHRILTAIYVPDYFIGRSRTSDGLLGDPINLAWRGQEAQVHRALERAGWVRADDLSLHTGWRIVTSTLTRRSYAAAPVSPLMLFRRRQDFAYQQEVAGTPYQRHHVRFWRCPDGWLLPGGFAVDWLAAGTFDRSVGLSLFTLQVTHRIDEDIDGERDHIVDTVRAANPDTVVTVIRGFSSGYHARNGGGDLMKTDGDLPVVDLTALPVDPAAQGMVEVADAGGPTPHRLTPHRPSPPAQTIFGASVAGLRGLLLIAGAGLIAFADQEQARGALSFDVDADTAASVVVALLVAAAVDLGLAVATLRGRDWSRLVLAGTSLVSLGATFVSRFAANSHAPMNLGLLPLAISVLVLLALSSDSARGYADQCHQLRRSRRALAREARRPAAS